MREDGTDRSAARVVVVGGTGCGGRAVVSALRRSGHRVLSISRGQNGTRPDITCDRHNTTKLQGILDDFQPTVVVDQVAYSPRDVTTLLSCFPATVQRYIFISSAIVYGPGGARPYAETDPTRPEGPAASAKLEAETQARTWTKPGRTTICLRLGWLYGPGHAPLTPLGRDPSLPDRLLGQEAIHLPADDPPNVQPWFAEDHGRLVNDLISVNNPPELLNAAAQESYSWAELIAAWADTVGGPPPRFVPCSDENLASRCAPALRPYLPLLLKPPRLDVSRMRQMIDPPPHTALRNGFSQVLEWLTAD